MQDNWSRALMSEGFQGWGCWTIQLLSFDILEETLNVLWQKTVNWKFVGQGLLLPTVQQLWQTWLSLFCRTKLLSSQSMLTNVRSGLKAHFHCSSFFTRTHKSFLSPNLIFLSQQTFSKTFRKSWLSDVIYHVQDIKRGRCKNVQLYSYEVA